jgi:carboxylesterase
MNTIIIPTAEPFFFPGGKTGCLLVHGFTGSPKEMHWMGEYLAGQGHSVLGIRLAGHATCPEDMVRTRWRDWVASVEDGWNILCGSTQRIFLMGLSMGGVLSLEFASRFPVAGVVTMSTPFALHDQRLAFASPLSTIIPHINKGLPDWHNPEAFKDHVEYPYNPTRSIAELIDLLSVMREALPKVTAPVLLVHSHQDGSLPSENMTAIYEHLGSKDKQMMYVENSGHVIPREPERMRVFQAVQAFVERVCKATA